MPLISLPLKLPSKHAASPIFPFDFISTSDTVTFASGSRPLDSLPFFVPVIDDNLVENTETVSLVASVVGGVAVGRFTAGDTAEIEITDNDRMLAIPNQPMNLTINNQLHGAAQCSHAY